MRPLHLPDPGVSKFIPSRVNGYEAAAGQVLGGGGGAATAETTRDIFLGICRRLQKVFFPFATAISSQQLPIPHPTRSLPSPPLSPPLISPPHTSVVCYGGGDDEPVGF